jgi:NTE family protein
MHALTLLIEQRLIVEVAHYADRADIIVLPPLCPLSVSAIDFSASEELMTKAHATSGAWLDDGDHHLPHQERFLSLHDHRWARGPKDHHHGVERVNPRPTYAGDAA